MPTVYCLRIRRCRLGSSCPPEYSAPDRFSATGRLATAQFALGTNSASDPRPSGLAARNAHVRLPVESSAMAEQHGRRHRRRANLDAIAGSLKRQNYTEIAVMGTTLCQAACLIPQRGGTILKNVAQVESKARLSSLFPSPSATGAVAVGPAVP